MFKEITREELHAEYIKRGLTEEEATLACNNTLKEHWGYSSWDANLLNAFRWFETEQGFSFWYKVHKRINNE